MQFYHYIFNLTSLQELSSSLTRRLEMTTRQAMYQKAAYHCSKSQQAQDRQQWKKLVQLVGSRHGDRTPRAVNDAWILMHGLSQLSEIHSLSVRSVKVRTTQEQQQIHNPEMTKHPTAYMNGSQQATLCFVISQPMYLQIQ